MDAVTDPRQRLAEGICNWCWIRPRRPGQRDCLQCHRERALDRYHRRKRTAAQLRILILRASTLARVDELMLEMIDRGELRVKP